MKRNECCQPLAYHLSRNIPCSLPQSWHVSGGVCKKRLTHLIVWEEVSLAIVYCWEVHLTNHPLAQLGHANWAIPFKPKLCLIARGDLLKLLLSSALSGTALLLSGTALLFSSAALGSTALLLGGTALSWLSSTTRLR